jgi:hypothetical protein
MLAIVAKATPLGWSPAAANTEQNPSHGFRGECGGMSQSTSHHCGVRPRIMGRQAGSAWRVPILNSNRGSLGCETEVPNPASSQDGKLNGSRADPLTQMLCDKPSYNFQE